MFSIYKYEKRNELYNKLKPLLICAVCVKGISSREKLGRNAYNNVICKDCESLLIPINFSMSNEQKHVLFTSLIDTIKPNVDFLKELIQILQCPVCYYQVGSYEAPGLHQCDNGHAVCSRCAKFTETCPMCRANFKDKPETMSQILQISRVLLSSQPCINAPNGCRFKTYYYQLPDHEITCRFSLFKCKAENCSWSGKERDLVSHALLMHKGSITTESTNYFKLEPEIDNILFEILQFNQIIYLFAYCKFEEVLTIAIKLMTRTYGPEKINITLTFEEGCTLLLSLPIIHNDSDLLSCMKTKKRCLTFKNITRNQNVFHCSIEVPAKKETDMFNILFFTLFALHITILSGLTLVYRAFRK